MFLLIGLSEILQYAFLCDFIFFFAGVSRPMNVVFSYILLTRKYAQLNNLHSWPGMVPFLGTFPGHVTHMVCARIVLTIATLTHGHTVLVTYCEEHLMCNAGLHWI